MGITISSEELRLSPNDSIPYGYSGFIRFKPGVLETNPEPMRLYKVVEGYNDGDIVPAGLFVDNQNARMYPTGGFMTISSDTYALVLTDPLKMASTLITSIVYHSAFGLTENSPFSSWTPDIPLALSYKKRFKGNLFSLLALSVIPGEVLNVGLFFEKHYDDVARIISKNSIGVQAQYIDRVCEQVRILIEKKNEYLFLGIVPKSRITAHELGGK